MTGLRLVHDRKDKARPDVARLVLPGLSLGGQPILGPVDLRLQPGETVALCGPSGVGKTTLMRALAGLENSHAGTVMRPLRIAMVFQEPALLPWRTLRDNLTITTGIAAKQAETTLAEVGLGGRGDLFPGQLSLGQQRRMALARAFALSPQLLLMDEPFVSLDPKLADEMMRLFEDLRAGKDLTTLIVTHAPEEARRLADRVLWLRGSPALLSSDAG